MDRQIKVATNGTLIAPRMPSESETDRGMVLSSEIDEAHTDVRVDRSISTKLES
jgi:hypothetical protein